MAANETADRREWLQCPSCDTSTVVITATFLLRAPSDIGDNPRTVVSLIGPTEEDPLCESIPEAFSVRPTIYLLGECRSCEGLHMISFIQDGARTEIRTEITDSREQLHLLERLKDDRQRSEGQ